MKNVAATGGGDTPECYELALKEIREKLRWRSGMDDLIEVFVASNIKKG